MSTRLLAILLGFVLDLLVGDPNWFPHPVRLVGLFISTLERAIRRVCKTKKALRIGAIVLTTLTISATMGATALVLHLLALLGSSWNFVGMVFFSWTVLSATSLAREARAVCRALQQGLADGRKQVSRIVGRDTQDLTESEVLKATIETVAENTTDGVVSPLLYLVLGGPILAMGIQSCQHTGLHGRLSRRTLSGHRLVFCPSGRCPQLRAGSDYRAPDDDCGLPAASRWTQRMAHRSA